MRTLRFLHTGDWHLSSEPQKGNKARASLNQIVEYCKETKVNVIIHSGDMWDKKQSFSEISAVPMGIDYLRKLSALVDFIFIVKGNNSHDEPKSISLLHQLEPNIYAYEYPVCLGVFSALDDSSNFEIIELMREKYNKNIQVADYIVSLIPYPTKASLLIEDSIDNNNAEFIQKFEEVFEHIGEVTSAYACPKILAFHGNVVGSRLSTGQTLVSQDIMVAPSTLEKAYQHYYALGHIHLRQELKPHMIYSGSIYNKSWGETEQKSFEVVEFTQDTSGSWDFESQQIMLTSARPMITLNAEFKDGEFCFEDPGYALEVGMKEYEYRLKVKVRENERNLVTDDKIENLKFLYTNDVKIEWNVIPVERESRSEQIMNCKTLLDEVREYAAITEQPINGTIEKKVSKLQEVAI